MLEAVPADRLAAQSERPDRGIEPRDILLLAKKIIDLLLTLQQRDNDNRA